MVKAVHYQKSLKPVLGMVYCRKEQGIVFVLQSGAFVLIVLLWAGPKTFASISLLDEK